jgi:hypothetical protein
MFLFIERREWGQILRCSVYFHIYFPSLKRGLEIMNGRQNGKVMESGAGGDSYGAVVFQMKVFNS